VSVGATLAAARRRAGLSVAEVSQRTRIPENIIGGIERDDYTVSGGEARDQIRAIAHAVGADPAPLLDEFDETWRNAFAAASAAAAPMAASSSAAPAVPGAAAPPPTPPALTAAAAYRPSMPTRTRERRRVRRAATLAVLVLAVIGFAVYKAVSGVTPAHRATAASSPQPGHPAGSVAAASAGVQGSTSPAATAADSTARPTGSVSASAAPASSAPASPVAARALTVARVTAFGPGGGDGAAQAALALSGNPATPWRTDWYATPAFGGLYSGTGLLVDLGQAVTVTSVRLSLGAAGASLQLRAGDQPAAASLRPVAAAADAPASLQLTLSLPAHARYLLIWFTKLPPDGAGTYQASIYQIAVRGQR
jgi:cytoskeletal protein RodZ